MKNSPLLANYSLNVFLEAFVFWRAFFFSFLWSIWRRSALEADFSSESSARLLWEGSLPVPQRIAHILLCYS